jgi:hypothetical protein
LKKYSFFTTSIWTDIINRGIHCMSSDENMEKLYFKHLWHIKGAVSRFYCASKICANLKTVCQQLMKLGVKYDILFIIPSLCRTSLLYFKNWRLLHLFQSCSINFKRFFEPFILANQRRDTIKGNMTAVVH